MKQQTLQRDWGLTDENSMVVDFLQNSEDPQKTAIGTALQNEGY